MWACVVHVAGSDLYMYRYVYVYERYALVDVHCGSEEEVV